MADSEQAEESESSEKSEQGLQHRKTEKLRSLLQRYWPADPLLYSSGLIAGEALSGILVALWMLYAGPESLSEWPVGGFLLFLL
ncbi:MAG: hypothetical protein KDK25_05585, partial [Leptospiraceae bacterium]|nr:hypothetical protein [Leptospiraceae bacterium]